MTYDSWSWKRVLEDVFMFGRSRATYAALALRYKISKRTLSRWVNRFDRLGVGDPIRKRERKGYTVLVPAHFQFALGILHDVPIAYPSELAAAIMQQFGTHYTAKQIHRALLAAGISRKVLENRALEQNKQARDLYTAHMQQYSARQLVFFDETHVKPTDLRRRYGYSYIGTPAFLKVPNARHGQGTPCCGLAAMALDGMMSISIKEGNVDGDVVFACLRDEVLPHMNPYPQEMSVLVMDNASTHDHARVHQLCAQSGVICIFLPPYSYDFNPIELAFHEAKQFVRTKYGLAGGVIRDRLLEGLQSVGAVSAHNYFQHCRYTVTDMDREWAGL
jgi:transposase